MTRENHQLKTGEILQGKYLIREQLGDGASGTVYVAEHLVLSAEVAIKVLHPRFAENELMRRRFLDEARTLARLKSRYIVRILDADLDSTGVAFIAMEYVGGSDLEKYISKRAPLAPTEALRIALEVSLALKEAHACGIVHRDIKPENILLTEDSFGEVHVKVADFGLAKRVHLKLSRQSTSNDQPIGTPCYMAPEQMLRPAEVDHRADIFSMGVLLYEMVTGFLPFGGETVEQTMQSVLASEPPRASDLDARVPLELSELIARCLVKDPELRLGSIVQLIDEISFIQQLLTPAAPPQIPLELTRNRERRDSSLTTSAPAVVSVTAPAEKKSRRGTASVLAFAAVAALAAGGLVYTDAPVAVLSEAAQHRAKQEFGLELVGDRLPTLPFTLKETPRSFHTAQSTGNESSTGVEAAEPTSDVSSDSIASTHRSQAPYIPLSSNARSEQTKTEPGADKDSGADKAPRVETEFHVVKPVGAQGLVDGNLAEESNLADRESEGSFAGADDGKDRGSEQLSGVAEN